MSGTRGEQVLHIMQPPIATAKGVKAALLHDRIAQCVSQGMALALELERRSGFGGAGELENISKSCIYVARP